MTYWLHNWFHLSGEWVIEWTRHCLHTFSLRCLTPYLIVQLGVLFLLVVPWDILFSFVRSVRSDSFLFKPILFVVRTREFLSFTRSIIRSCPFHEYCCPFSFHLISISFILARSMRSGVLSFSFQEANFPFLFFSQVYCSCLVVLCVIFLPLLIIQSGLLSVCARCIR